MNVKPQLSIQDYSNIRPVCDKYKQRDRCRKWYWNTLETTAPEIYIDGINITSKIIYIHSETKWKSTKDNCKKMKKNTT